MPIRRIPSRHKRFLLVVLIAFLAVIWPGYVPVARIQPLILGLPLALAWLVFWLGVVFGALVITYRADIRAGQRDEDRA